MILEETLKSEALKKNTKARVFYALIDVNVKSPFPNQQISSSFRGGWLIKEPLKNQIESHIKSRIHPLAELIGFNIRFELKKTLQK